MTFPNPEAEAAVRAHFEGTGAIISVTADPSAQLWTIPETGEKVLAADAQRVSIEVRRAAGQMAL